MAPEENSPTADRELHITKLVDAPIELVWTIWTDPAHIVKWWGPDGFTTTIHKMEVKPGGSWEFIMHGPDGRDYRNKNTFKEIVKHKRIVFQHVTAPKHTTTVNFSTEGKKTLVAWHMLFDTKEDFEMAIKTFGAREGLRQNTERLVIYLQQLNKMA